MSILFISVIYCYILYYVLHLSLQERYRQKRQVALLRRVLILLIMLMIPGVFTTFLLILWMVNGTIPEYSFKISTLLDTIGHTGCVLTIFISHSKIRRQYHIRHDFSQIRQYKSIKMENCELILTKEAKKNEK